ncbi:TPA: hypothetical protein DDW35_11475, partial [Candidatus Sumerlaeota bacterium]|nr:hypothetical protein [Candidatus Sumerlaeota bacterium]
MARVLPFVGTRYNPKTAEDLATVMAPPYDVITPEMQEHLYNLAPHNFVRLDLGKEQVDDDEYSNKYQRAASLLKEWKSSGVLMDDPCKNFYIYQQEFKTPDKKTHIRTGFFSAVKLEELGKGKIHPHEYTFEAPKEDRLKLLRATHSNLSSIVYLYSDPEHATDEILNAITSKEAPRLEITTEDKVIHRLWLLSNSAKVKQLSALMQNKEFVIADGHHRYETAVRYAKEMNRLSTVKKGESPAYTYTMAFLVNSCSEGSLILPTHRVLSAELGENVDTAEVLEDLEEYFDVTPIKIDVKKPVAEGTRLMEKLESLAKKGTAFVMLLPGGKGYFLTLKPKTDIRSDMPEELSDEVAALDVSILHQYIIARLWVGNPEIELDDKDIFYEKDAAIA